MLSPETHKTLAGYGSTEAEFIDALRLLFPRGHEDFLPQCVAEMELHSAKSHDYASGGDPLGNFKRVASILGNYKGLDLSDPRVVALVYTMKQIDAVLWSLAQNITAKVEGIVPRLDDVAVYAKIIKCLTIELARNKAISEQFGTDEALRKATAAQMAGEQARQFNDNLKSRVEVSAKGRNEVPGMDYPGGYESEPAYRRRMGFDDGPKQAQCPELNKTRSGRDR